MPSEAEIILEGTISPDHVVEEGPFGEFVGYLSPVGDAPVVEITAVTHRARPIYHAINGYGRETVMLRKYVLEASLLKVLQAAVPIVMALVRIFSIADEGLMNPLERMTDSITSITP